MTWNRPNSFGESVKPLNLPFRERWARIGDEEFETHLDAREHLNDQIDELYGDRYLDQERFFSTWAERPIEMSLRRA